LWVVFFLPPPAPPPPPPLQLYPEFYCRYEDPSYLKRLKIDVLIAIADQTNAYEIAEEMTQARGATCRAAASQQQRTLPALQDAAAAVQRCRAACHGWAKLADAGGLVAGLEGRKPCADALLFGSCSMSKTVTRTWPVPPSAPWGRLR
jgi:hypothetical protein